MKETLQWIISKQTHCLISIGAHYLSLVINYFVWLTLLGLAYFILLWTHLKQEAFSLRPYRFWTLWTTITCLWQLDWLRAYQLLWTTVYSGKRRIPSLGCLEWEQCLPHWASHVLPAHLLSCKSKIFTFADGDRARMRSVWHLWCFSSIMLNATGRRMKVKECREITLFL